MVGSVELAQFLNGVHLGTNREISKVIKFSIENSNEQSLMWLNEKKLNQFSKNLKGTIIVPKSFNIDEPIMEGSIILVDNPRLAFQKTIKKYFEDIRIALIEDNSFIAESSIIGQNCYIGHNVVIEDNVKIGDNCEIMHNTVIFKNTIIGKNCKIGSNCTIGGVGFGYEKNDLNEFELIQHLGNVVFEDNVEIGNNTCIDRAVLGSTLLQENVKVDNLVHIAHGCNIGKNSLLIANSMIAGSVNIGENVWVAPSSSILNQRTVHSSAVIGMGAVVLKDVPLGDVVVGNPSKSIKK